MKATKQTKEQKELNKLKKDIKKVLNQYFEYHDNGDKSKTFCEWFAAQDAIDEIHDIIGDI